ncbi:MAG: hypothetical protein ACTSRA_10760, partial [Promethearchaeota archaeon]
DSIIFEEGGFVDIIEIISGLTGKNTRYDPDIHVLYKDGADFSSEWRVTCIFSSCSNEIF